jgi:hypothetical protein
VVLFGIRGTLLHVLKQFDIDNSNRYKGQHELSNLWSAYLETRYNSSDIVMDFGNLPIILRDTRMVISSVSLAVPYYFEYRINPYQATTRS